MKTEKIMGILTELAKLHTASPEKSNLVKLEYLFYTDLDLRGEDLAEDLMRLSYSAEVDATHRKCDCTRVFGESALIRNEEEIIKQWNLEMREVGNYHGCDFVCYSIITNPGLNLDELVNVTQAVSAQQYEKRKEAHLEGLPLYMELRRLHASDALTTRLDFFFYAKSKDNAEALAGELRKFNYEVFVDKTSHPDAPYSITGQTPAMPDDVPTMKNWVATMNQLGYIQDCDFDGWGSPCTQEEEEEDGSEEECQGGWFSDTTSDEVLRKSLGLPPLEE